MLAGTGPLRKSTPCTASATLPSTVPTEALTKSSFSPTRPKSNADLATLIWGEPW